MTVALISPVLPAQDAAPVAMTVNEIGPATVGVPLTTPVVGEMLKPDAGNPVAVQTNVELFMPLATKACENGVPTTGLLIVVGVTVRVGQVTLMVAGWVTVLAVLVADSVIGNVPVAVGVPLKLIVPAGLDATLTPAGNAPTVWVMTGSGTPEAVALKAAVLPAVRLYGPNDVKLGACNTLTVSVWFAVPATLVATRLHDAVPVAVAVPETVAAPRFNVSPAGSAQPPGLVSVAAGMPVVTMLNVCAAPTTKFTLFALVNVGVLAMVMVTVCVAAGETMLLAVSGQL